MKISREELIDELRSRCWCLIYADACSKCDEDLPTLCRSERELFKAAADMLEADAETLRPKGRWEYYSSTMQECSVCKRHTARHKYDYCPRCGADMRGDSE